MDTTTDPVIESGTYDVGEFAEELSQAPDNHQIGTSLWFANDRVRVFELRLAPGQRGPFHCHDKTYFWTVVEGGRGRQHYADGTYIVRDYRLGETTFLEHSPDEVTLHDLENVGTTTLRFVTVELLGGGDSPTA